MFDEMLFELGDETDWRQVLKRIARGDPVDAGAGRAPETKRAIVALTAMGCSSK